MPYREDDRINVTDLSCIISVLLPPTDLILDLSINSATQIFVNPSPDTWADILRRPGQADHEQVRSLVLPILDQVRQEGDKAVAEFNAKFGGWSQTNLWVTDSEFEAADQKLDVELKTAIRQAATNIRLFHSKQLAPIGYIETMPGVLCWRKSVGINRVGLYIPGGSAPLFSTVLMLGIPALLAGCPEVVLATPADANGHIHPAILFAAKHVGIDRIYKAGGAQAIAAMAYGTETFSPVNKIFGPGNQFVTMAKQLVNQHGTAIDMPAGPSEVLVYADQAMPTSWVAADLLSQAEHGPDSQVVLVAETEAYVEAVIKDIDRHLAGLDRQLIADVALAHARFIVMPDPQIAMALINQYAPEHLILALQDALILADEVKQAGSVFLGYHSPESVGDYASGTNHTLPTYGYAAAYSGVSVDSFVKKITMQQLSSPGLALIGPTVMTMAKAESLDAHALAVSVRLDQDNQNLNNPIKTS